MPSGSNAPSAEELERFVNAVDIRSSSVSLSVKMNVREGDAFRGAEASVSLTFRLDHLQGAPDDVVRLVALKHAPSMWAKVYSDLVVADVLDPTEAAARIARATKFYEAAYERLLHGRDGVADGSVRPAHGTGTGPGPGPD